MEGTRERKGIVVVSVVLCVAMLVLVLATLMAILWPDGTQTSASSDAWLAQTASDGTLGMVLIDIVDESTASYYHVSDMGVYVLAVDEQSQAYREGIRSGDRIVSANSMPIGVSNELSELEAAMPADGTLVLTLSRGAEEDILTVHLGVGSDTEL